MSEPLQVVKWGHWVTYSREQAIEFGIIEPTPEEKAEREERLARYRAEREAEIRTWRLDVLPSLAGVGDRVSRMVLDLHTARIDYSYATCEGCDAAGADMPDWPCQTVRLVAAHHGIALPDGPMPALE